MDHSSARRRVSLDEKVIAAHEAITAANDEVGRAAQVLLRRIEELTLELEEAREGNARETSDLGRRHEAALSAAAQAHGREVQELHTALAQREVVWTEREAVLENECAVLKEKLEKIYTTLT